MATEKTGMPLEERMRQLLQHLGIRQAHFAGATMRDWDGLATTCPELLSSLTVVLSGVDPNKVSSLASRLLVFTGDKGKFPERVRRAVESLPGATLVTLHDVPAWSDVVADYTDEIGTAMIEFLARTNPSEGEMMTPPAEESGDVAGITYHIRGSGPTLVLLPLGLSPSQWDPLLPLLSERYCTITLGGAHFDQVYRLELRGRAAGYLCMVRYMIEEVQVQPGQSLLDVGCGTGIIVRWLANHTRGENPITGVDLNAYFLREATALARQEGLQDAVEFKEGNAEALPFPEDHFDVTLSATVMEEVDADKMMAEMVRVTKPGGIVGVIVRAVDRPFLINLPLRTELKEKVEGPKTWGPGVAERGCSDASLYLRFHEAGLTRVKKFPQLVSFDGSIPVARPYLEGGILPILSHEEAQEWQTAWAQAEAEGTVFFSWPHHCAVGTKAS